MQITQSQPQVCHTNLLTFEYYHQLACPQRCELPPLTCPSTQSEDCLFIDLFTPRIDTIRDQLVPVYVFLPGGHFEQGGPDVILYDGTYIANKTNIIIIVGSYRLGALGWLVNSKAGMEGNYGFTDQLQLLQWIQNNIAAFGGDPKQVTIGGQSAGASSTTAHLVSPASKGLFSKVIIESNPLVLPMRMIDDATENLGKPFAKQVGCEVNDFECFQNLSIEKILEGQYFMDTYKNLSIPLETFLPWAPTVSKGGLIPYQTFEAIEKGLYHKVPIMIGNVREEALLFIYMGIHNKLNTVEYLALIMDIFGVEDGVRILDWYRPLLDGDKRPITSVLGTDYIFLCPLRKILSQISQQNPQLPIYNYIFDHVLSFDAWGPRYNYCVGHVCHGAELPFVFHSIGTTFMPDMHFNPEEERLSASMVEYITNFVKFGNPNQGKNTTNLIQWPKFSADNRQTLFFQTPANQIVTDFHKKYCDELDFIGYDHGWFNQQRDKNTKTKLN
ncbi:predicted protein [Naegleria gruberi]|uniref:Carboxylic ester hydrolase n=1 Tax=Naegleria gruberi TaxID=5762 RepID=D2V1M1_NAEGR|nr:uncharacterized protein NAEGRDRAFT_30355 [Naegleria gruberi]EFC49335.1 predicted protein [Naegleria gruberi]|eukprot:XP_002682079.1 predicted protein [Naegleria gruberi strain NEG-M]